MKAWVCPAYGSPDVLVLREIATPAPKAGEILVRILATTVNSGDVRVRGARVPKGMSLLMRLALGWSGPRQPVLGSELAGIVEAVGEKITRFRAGDEVFAFPGIKMGCHAQYRVLGENERVFPKPENLSLQEAACISFGGTTALHYLRKAGLRSGEKILVVGASGAVGSAIVQIARHLGAEVTAATSPGNAALVRSLGASAVVDYRSDDFLAETGSYDAIAETSGAIPFRRARHALRKGGRFLAIAGGLPDMLAMIWSKALYGKRVIAGPAAESSDDVRQIAQWVRAGVLKPVIDRVYRFDEMREAHAYVDTGRKKGSVVIAVTLPASENDRTRAGPVSNGEARR